MCQSVSWVTTGTWASIASSCPMTSENLLTVSTGGSFHALLFLTIKLLWAPMQSITVWNLCSFTDPLAPLTFTMPSRQWKTDLAWNICTDFSIFLSYSFRFVYFSFFCSPSSRLKTLLLFAISRLQLWYRIRFFFQMGRGGQQIGRPHAALHSGLWESVQYVIVRMNLGIQRKNARVPDQLRSGCLMCTEGDTTEAAGDQPARHGCHSGGALCTAGDRRPKLWYVAMTCSTNQIGRASCRERV